jgi:formyl-CoA transferase/CoA:oxalate CoA-transferase
MVADLSDKTGKTTKTLGVPVKLSGTPGSIRTAPVGFGESTPSILRELGYTQEQIVEFEKKGIF